MTCLSEVVQNSLHKPSPGLEGRSVASGPSSWGSTAIRDLYFFSFQKCYKLPLFSSTLPNPKSITSRWPAASKARLLSANRIVNAISSWKRNGYGSLKNKNGNKVQYPNFSFQESNSSRSHDVAIQSLRRGCRRRAEYWRAEED